MIWSNPDGALDVTRAVPSGATVAVPPDSYLFGGWFHFTFASTYCRSRRLESIFKAAGQIMWNSVVGAGWASNQLQWVYVAWLSMEFQHSV
jgi:hypothetical protein